MGKVISVRQAMQLVAENPHVESDEIIQMPVHDLVCRTLFDIANRPDASERGSMARANKARKLILDRMVGKRKAGSHPASRVQVNLEFVDLTGGELGVSGEDVQPAD